MAAQLMSGHLERTAYQSVPREERADSEIDDEDISNVSGHSGTANNRIFQLPKARIKFVALIVKIILFSSVLTCLVFSKITLIKLFCELHLLSNFSKTTTAAISSSHEAVNAARLYWMLLFIVMIPSLITWMRSLLAGLLSKSPRRPWPKCTAIVGGILFASVEGVTECLLVFYAFITLPPVLSLLVMCGILSTQSLFETISSIRDLCQRSWRDNFTPVDGGNTSVWYRIGKCHHLIVIFIMLLGVICQVGGLGTVTTFLVIAYKDKSKIMGILLAVPCLLVLSMAWSRIIQKSTFKPTQESIEKARRILKCQQINVTAKWKASFIASSVRLLIYPFVSYLVFRKLYKLKAGNEVDPWSITRWTSFSIKEAFDWDDYDLSVFIVHIVSSFLAYAISYISCYMTLHKYGLALPTLLATPLSLGIYFISNSSVQFNEKLFILYPFQDLDAELLDWKSTLLSSWYITAFGCAFLLWVGQILTSSFNLFRAKNAILAADENMFVRPYYNSILIEQSLIINRNVTHKPQVQADGRRESSLIFVCSTMFRENSIEMKQLLQSIKKIAKHYQEEKRKFDDQCDRYESHIFFDGGCRKDELSPFAVQLMSLIPKTMKVKLDDSNRQKTPYGYRFSWQIDDCMPFVIHLKDNHKVRNKKRWSQVMYMNYILDYRFGKEGLRLDNTYLLTTDADIKFKAESAVVLLDMLARDTSVGAVCAHSHPLGSGPLYWYQLFDYAIGHWLQKSTEHILGSVLCCPGCFSMFRCSALKECLKTYSTEVSGAMEFLTKDMGEDRWLCTLLVEKGWRLEYCAISNDYTYCPINFDEFFKQRRRWIPSTIANLWLLVTKASKITSKNESISWAFIIYQLIVLTSTVIAPATVILVIASGLSGPFHINSTAILVILVLVSLFYGIICVYASQKTQFDTAKVLTFIFSVIMAVVAVGLIKENVESILSPFKNTTSTDQDNDDSPFFSTNSIKKLPISESTIYLILFAFIYITTALLHFSEFFIIVQFLWYFLGLPFGYLLLLIYSMANLNDRRWGTREAKDNSEKDLLLVLREKIKDLIYKCLKMNQKQQNAPPENQEKEDDKRPQREEYESQMGLEGPPSDDEIPRERHRWLMRWLEENMCQHFYNNFAREGYTESWFVANMTRNDLVGLGVRPNGYLLRLEKAIKTIPPTPVQIGIYETVAEWITALRLDMPQERYILKFQEAGYCTKQDVENLIHITKEELINDIGVKKKAHIKRFMEGIQKLRIRTEDEERMAEAETILQTTNDKPNSPLEDEEIAFWMGMADTVLRPTPEGLTATNELRSDLKFMRNYTLLSVLLINLMWLLLIQLFTFGELKTLGLSGNVLGLLFLAVYGVLFSIQFIGMLLHRVVTLSHYIARLNQALPIENYYTDEHEETNTMSNSPV